MDWKDRFDQPRRETPWAAGEADRCTAETNWPWRVRCQLQIGHELEDKYGAHLSHLWTDGTLSWIWSEIRFVYPKG